LASLVIVTSQALPFRAGPVPADRRRWNKEVSKIISRLKFLVIVFALNSKFVPFDDGIIG
jgi:hypothetical protein